MSCSLHVLSGLQPPKDSDAPRHRHVTGTQEIVFYPASFLKPEVHRRIVRKGSILITERKALLL